MPTRCDRAAAGQGVEIVVIDSAVNSENVATYIGTDNYSAGKMAAEAALEGNRVRAALPESGGRRPDVLLYACPINRRGIYVIPKSCLRRRFGT